MNKVFYLKFDNLKWVRVRDILSISSYGAEVEVIKICKSSWWKRFIYKLGFKVHIGELKVKYITK